MVVLPTEITVSCGTTPPQQHALPPGEYVIGSDAAADIRVSGDGLAPRHAVLSLRVNDWLVEDLGSAAGTFVNGEKITGPRPVFPRQKIRVGTVTIALRRPKTSPAAVEPVGSQTETVRRLIPEEIRGDGKYEIGPMVGRGGMGVILDAHEVAAQRNVAMKLMRDCSRPADISRFVLEAQITAQLEHPNIVPIHEVGVNELEQPFYTMKFVRGDSLGKVLGLLALDDPATAKKYPLSVLLTIFQKVCDAIAFAHSKGIIHRDLKPENVMLGEYGEALVMDWGVAKMLGREGSTGVMDDECAEHVRRPDQLTAGGDTSAVTVVGTVMGTLQYMAPEQAKGQIGELDARADIFALGAILYHLLTLQPPFTGEAEEILETVRAGGGVRPITALSLKKLPHLPGGRVPESLAAVAMKAMASNPSERYASVPDLQREIGAYQSGFATSAENAGAWKLLSLFLRRHRTISIAATVVLLSGVFFTHKWLQAEASRRFADGQRDVAEGHSYVSHLLDAGRHLAEGYPENARELLHRHQQEPSGRDLRGWEWFHLSGQLNQDRLRVPAHDGGVLAISVLPDGSRVATAGADGQVAVWRTRGLVPEFRLPVHPGPVHAVSFHDGGGMLASCGVDGLVRVWDTATRKMLAEVPVDGVRALAWQPNDGGNPRLAIGGLKRGVMLWNPPLKGESGRMETVYETAQTVALHWSADGSKLACGALEGDNPIKVADLVGRRRYQQGLPAGSDVFSVALSPSGRYVAAGSKHLNVAIFEVFGGRTFNETLHHGPVSALAWSPDGRQLASASHDRTIRVSSPGELQAARQIFTGHVGEINALAWTRMTGAEESGLLLSGGADGTLRAWSPTKPEGEAFTAEEDNWIAATRWSPDGSRIAVAAFRDYVNIYAPASGGKPVRLPTRKPAFDVEWSRAGDRLAIAERAFGVELLGAADGKLLGGLAFAGVNRVVWSPGDKYVAGAGPDGVRVWDAESGAQIAAIPRPAGSVAWASDGRRIAVGCADGAIEIWDGLAGKMIAIWRPAPPEQAGTVSSKHEPPRQVFDLAWSPDWESLAFVTQDSVAGLLSARDGRLLHTFTGHGGGIWRLAWSPDGRRLATCGQDGFCFVFNAQTGDQLARLMRRGSGLELHAVDWSPDGRQLVSGGYDTEVRVWDASRGYGIEAAERLELQVRMQPGDLRGRRELATVCTRLGWAGRARSAFARAQELAPDDPALRREAEDAEASFARAFAKPLSQ